MPEEKDFMIEKIKDRPVNKKKLIRRTLITASMAVIFGLIACFTFLVLEPIISKWLYPEEPAQIVLFPEDHEEKSPEEMLSDTMQELQNSQDVSKPSHTISSSLPESLTLQPEQVSAILDKVFLDKENYEEIYFALSDYMAELKDSMVPREGSGWGVM